MAEYGFRWNEVESMPDNAVDFLCDEAERHYAERLSDQISLQLVPHSMSVQRQMRIGIVQKIVGEGWTANEIIGQLIQLTPEEMRNNTSRMMQ